jgi:23S rRNA pseudouridine1911/1915/1917 synthase
LQDGIREFDRQALHAKELELIHPASRELIGWTSDLPSDMKCLLEILAGG